MCRCTDFKGNPLLARSDYPGAISRLVAELQTHPEVGWVHADTDIIDENGTIIDQATFSTRRNSTNVYTIENAVKSILQ